MKRKDPQKAKRKDIVTPRKLWNESSRGKMKLAEKVPILEVIQTRNSQSGISFRVQTMGGYFLDLDAAWFLEYAPRTKTEKREQGTFFKDEQPDLL